MGAALGESVEQREIGYLDQLTTPLEVIDGRKTKSSGCILKWSQIDKNAF